MQNKKISLLLSFFLLVFNSLLITANAQVKNDTVQLPQYKIKAVYLPEEKRPEVKYSLEQLQFKNIGGELPTYDGQQFQINFSGQSITSQEAAKKLATQFLESLKSPLKMDNQIRTSISATSAKADQKFIDAQISAGEDSTKKKLSGQFGTVSKSSTNMLSEMGDNMRKEAQSTVSVYRFDEYFNDVIIDNTAINITNRGENSIVSIHGRFYNTVNTTNNKKLPAADAVAKAVAQIKSSNKYENVSGDSKNAQLVLLPYAEGFKYVWKTMVTADGPYQVWIDAETGAVLQLLPNFFFSDNAKGLVFNPDPNAGTEEMTFEVDPSSGGKYTLQKTGILVLNNNGTDGTSGIVQVTDDGSGTANFNVSPINGTVVERTNQSGYNGQFQEVNIFANIFHERNYYMALGSQTFPSFTATFNDNNPSNNSSSSGTSSIILGIGGATTGTSTSCSQIFNSGIDVTVMAHEFGHNLNALQYGVGRGTMTQAINEGMADFWACTNFNTDIFGGWWAHNCPTPVQTGFIPRQAESTDIFPDHFSTGGSTEAHSAGQIICWANWSTRQEMNDATEWGTLSINLNVIKAMTTAGASITNSTTAKAIHDSYLDLLKQIIPLYKTDRLINKLLAGYARAGIFLSSQDAIIDIDHSYLNSTSATGPTFTIWTGEDYTFSGTTVVTTGTVPFNTQYQVEVANDEAFTSNLVNSGWLSGVVAGAGGTATWTLPTGNWNTLKGGTDIYFRVTTKDASGNNIRKSWEPGNNFLGVDVPVGRAAINTTGTQDCSCTASAAPSNSPMAFIPIMPLGLLLIYRRRKRGK